MNAKDTSLKKEHESLDWRNEDPEYKKFADIVCGNIKRLMKAKKISQMSLLNKMSKRYSKANNWSEQSQVSKRINGREFISAYDLYKIASILEVPFEELFGVSNSSSSNNEFNNTSIKNIRKLMSLASPEISEDKLSEIVGLTQYEFGKCMGGSGTFTLEQLSKIADFFSVSVDYLIGRNTYSNFEVCKMISDFILNGALAYEIKQKSEDVWEYPCDDRSIYEQVRDQVQHKKDEGISFYNFIESRIDEETTPNYVKHSNIIDYLIFYLPMCKKLSDDEDYYDDLLEFETFGNLNSDNVIINHFLKEFTNALKLKETGTINEDEFKRRVNDVFREVMQLSLCEKKTKLRSLFFPEFSNNRR